MIVFPSHRNKSSQSREALGFVNCTVKPLQATADSRRPSKDVDPLKEAFDFQSLVRFCRFFKEIQHTFSKSFFTQDGTLTLRGIPTTPPPPPPPPPAIPISPVQWPGRDPLCNLRCRRVSGPPFMTSPSYCLVLPGWPVGGGGASYPILPTCKCKILGL